MESQTGSANWHNLKIEFDLDRLEGSDEENRIISEYILDKIRTVLEGSIKVFGTGVLPKIKSTSCDKSFTMSTRYSQSPTPADLILVVEYIKEDSNYLAFAVPCYLDVSTRRPIVGLISINSKNVKPSGKTLMSNYYTLLHEIFHILAITPPLFQYFLNQPVYTDSDRSGGIYKFILPEVLLTKGYQRGQTPLRLFQLLRRPFGK